MNIRRGGLPPILQLLEAVRPGSLHEMMPDVFEPPPVTITLADLVEQIYIVMRNDPDPTHADRAVGSLYGQVFKRKEAAMNPWTPPETTT